MAPQPPPTRSLTNPQDTDYVSTTYSLSSQELHELRDRAVAAQATAYCPYSRFRVGAVLLTKQGGHFIPGANVENAAYPVGTCAERVALGRAVTEGYHTREGFKAIAVATDIAPPASPCGMCRQFIREFCDLDMPIVMFDKDGKYCILRLEELLPLSFGPEDLNGTRAPPPGL